jgi:hypothetical protein
MILGNTMSAKHSVSAKCLIMGLGALRSQPTAESFSLTREFGWLTFEDYLGGDKILIALLYSLG